MTLSEQQKKTRGAIPPCLVFIWILTTALIIYSCDGTSGIFQVVLADPIPEAISCGIIRNGSPSLHSSTSTILKSRTRASGYDEWNTIENNVDLVKRHGENHNHLPESASQSLCLRSLTARSQIFLKTLYWNDSCDETYVYLDKSRDTDERFIDFCWETVRESQPKSTRRSLPSPSKPEYDRVVAAGASLSSTILTDEREKLKNAKQSLQNVAQKVDLLFATRMVRNNEISLPLFIAEYYREEKGMPELLTLEEDATNASDKPSDPRLPTCKSPTVSQLRSTIDKSSYASHWVDLTGKWRPAQTISRQDLEDYNLFLTACCSDQISYWTRKLLTSSTIVSRQEFVVKQLDRGRIVEFVDIHPLSSNAWNRTIVTSRITGNRNRIRLGTNSPVVSREGNKKLDGFQPYKNRSNDPQGSKIVIEAYWQKNGTVHTSLIRKDCDHGDEDEHCVTSNGWLETKRYLISGKSGQDNFEMNQDERKAEMMVETIYHSTSFPTEANSSSNERRVDFDADGQDEATTTRMLWKWEQVIEP
mmetsp:Transcript_10957/g.26340  ORF Transcript_10957/g.26340 Transcript_10957/m.26340 type:complete len:532 (+) Transcript_10957:306-1901(+)|eukprot:CAMPEP_0197189948 /NCGR_PEP_ID=MMETSP1423-20130617/20698_1 /TAXON_ID=476441 /ORGANISM="Pseudo-nitzschia heimii, Strain UNC1101" /LENGTH=531 /DNA_ID=CAMNT_0042642215 /DNA_START=211 /DNA_END=1806 /DNA_ORIENTATION=-